MTLRKNGLVDISNVSKSGTSLFINSNLERPRHTVSRKDDKKEAGKKEPGKKLIIEHFYLKDAKANVSADVLQGKTMSVPVADLHLTDIGKKTNGATAGEASKQIITAITSSVTKATSSIFGSAVEGVKKGAEAVGGAIKGFFK